MALVDLCHHSLESEITLIEEVHPPPPSSDTMSIYMMSSSTDLLISTSNDGPSDLSLHCFSNDEKILEALTTLEYPWDDMHHHSFFLPEELVSQSDQFSMGKLTGSKIPFQHQTPLKKGTWPTSLQPSKSTSQPILILLKKSCWGHLAPQKRSMPIKLSSNNYVTSSPDLTLKYLA